MTNEEAIEILQMVKTETFYRYPKMNQALNLAISALEKQIPKDPIDNDFPYVICPSCGGSIYIGKIQDHIQNEENSFCEHCGQKISWGSDDE